MINEHEHIDAKDSTAADIPELGLDAEGSKWLRRAARLYEASTDYYQSSLFDSWRASLSHFRSEHAPGSKYTQDAYKHRSHVFRPKPRASVRALEATAATALFTNDDLLDVRPLNPSDPIQTEAGRLHKAILQHRLETTIPWFLTAIGAYQDTHVYGVCISRQSWDYRTKARVEYVPAMDEFGQPIVDEDGMMLGEEVVTREVISDKPDITLIAPDNFRFDPACDWRKPVESSPYLIECLPMYAGEVLAMMDQEDGWHPYSLGEVVALGSEEDGGETVRDAREGKGREDAKDVNQANEYSVVWVHFNIIRDEDGEDWAFYTLGTDRLLTDPRPLQEVDPLGRERYAVGFSTIEAHRSHPAATLEINRPLAEMLNDVTNQRLDNVKLVLNKRYAIRRGSKIDLGALMRNVPGGGVMMDDVTQDYRIMETPDVTQSSYIEQDRLAVESDELLGTFSQASVSQNRNLNETVGGMNLMASTANQVQELGLRTFIETWVEPVLRAMIKLEALYETDEAVLALAAGKSEIYHAIDDDLLMQDLLVRVNVGMGNTNPQQKLARFLEPLSAVAQLPEFLQELDFMEIGKEVFALAGMGDGERFMLDEEKKAQRAEQQQGQMDPQTQVKMQELQLKQAELQFKQQQWQAEQQMSMQRQQFEQEYKMAELQTRQEKDRQELALKEGITIAQLEAKLGMESQKLELKARETAAKLQTERDKVAATITERQNDRAARRENMQLGFDSYG